MLNMAARDIGTTRNRQTRFVVFKISSIEFRELKCRRAAGSSLIVLMPAVIDLMLAALVPVAQDAREQAWPEYDASAA